MKINLKWLCCKRSNCLISRADRFSFLGNVWPPNLLSEVRDWPVTTKCFCKLFNLKGCSLVNLQTTQDTISKAGFEDRNKYKVTKTSVLKKNSICGTIAYVAFWHCFCWRINDCVSQSSKKGVVKSQKIGPPPRVPPPTLARRAINRSKVGLASRILYVLATVISKIGWLISENCFGRSEEGLQSNSCVEICRLVVRCQSTPFAYLLNRRVV